MRQITTLLATTTLVLAITSVYLYRQLAAARELAQTEVACERERERNDRAARMEQIHTRIETALRAPNPEPTPPAVPPAAPDALPTGLPRIPEMTDEQRSWMTRRHYRSIFRELSLSDTEVAAILPVLVQQDLRSSRRIREPATSPPPDPQRDQAELAAVMGAEKAERFTSARKLLPAHNQVSNLRRRFDESGEPLSAEQQEALFGILAKKPAQTPFQQVEGDDPQRRMERMDTWMREREQRLREDAAPVLTPTQRKVMEEDDAFQDTMRTRANTILQPQAGSGAPAPVMRLP